VKIKKCTTARKKGCKIVGNDASRKTMMSQSKEKRNPWNLAVDNKAKGKTLMQGE
jgi:hypothetical protein